MKTTPTLLLLSFSLTFGAFAGTAQTLTCTFQFTGSGTLGTHTFTNTAITLTTVSNSPSLVSGPQTIVNNTAASIAISGLGTFQFTSPTAIAEIVSPPNSAPGSTVTESISFDAGGNIYSIQLNRTIVNSNSWNMLSSLGPITSGQSYISAWDVFPVDTNGGRLNLYSVNGVQLTFQAVFNGTPSTPSSTMNRTGVLSHIAAGGGWSTAITLVNSSSTAVPVTVALHNDDGSSLTLPVTTIQRGLSQTTTTSSVSATINPNATLLISTGDQVASTVVGWADVLTTGSLVGYAIFRQTPQTGSPSEGTVPLQGQFPSTVTLPYDNTAGFVMGVALANLSTSLASVTATIWDDSGNQLGTQFTTIAGNGHTAFVLPNQFPLMAGKRGIVKFQAAGGIVGLGLRFSPFGTFTSVPAI
jgi:hypothetical protein